MKSTKCFELPVQCIQWRFNETWVNRLEILIRFIGREENNSNTQNLPNHYILHKTEVINVLWTRQQTSYS